MPPLPSALADIPNGSVTSPRGFTAAAAHAGLKADGAPDVALLVGATSCATAGVFTKNALRAAPVVYDQDLLRERPGRIRAVAMNARVANACTGPEGLAAARAMAQAAEQAAGLPARTALVLSTGVIGVPLPLAQVTAGLQEAGGRLSPAGGTEAARAIMTTDTRPKHCAVRVDTAAGAFTVGGIAKGAGMIHPNLATLLAVLTTDAGGTPPPSRRCCGAWPTALSTPSRWTATPAPTTPSCSWPTGPPGWSRSMTAPSPRRSRTRCSRSPAPWPWPSSRMARERPRSWRFR